MEKKAKANASKPYSMAPSHTQTSRRTLRLTFAYDGSHIELVSQLRVEKITPPSISPCPDKNSAGYWVELQDESGNCLFHRLLPDAIRDSAEIYPQNKSLTRAPLRELKGRFEVQLPDLGEAARVVIVGHPLSSEKGLRRQEATRILATFAVKADGKVSPA